MNLAITIDAGNEVVSVICLFLLCFGLASALHYVIATVISVRSYDKGRRFQDEVHKRNLGDAVEKR